jgi:hypothetical protein
MAQAVFTDLVAMGLQDMELMSHALGDSVLTFWRFVSMKHTPFALEPVYEDGVNVQFGGTSTFKLSKQSDLVYSTFLEVTLPGICGATTAAGAPLEGVGQEPHWCQAVGQHVIQKCQLQIGGVVVDTLYSDWLFMNEELSGRPGRRLSEMTGAYDTVAQRQAQSRRSQVLYVPLPFWFSQNSGLALPVVSLHFHSVEFRFTWATRASCISLPSGSSATSAALVFKRTDGNTNAEEDDLTKTAVADSDLACRLLYFGVYLDESERSKYAMSQFQQTITQVQKHTAGSISHSVTAPTETTASKQVSERLLFNHVVSEIVFALRRSDNVTRTSGVTSANEHFNYGGAIDHADLTGAALDPVKSASIKFNNNDRVKDMPGSFYRLVTPYVHHTSLPREYVYCWSFALDPEDAQPTGGANFSRIDNAHLVLNIDSRCFGAGGTNTVDLLIFARNYNVMRYMFGLGSQKYGH